MEPNGAQPGQTETAKGRYERLAAERGPYLDRARECAALTIPHLIPPEGSNGSTDLPTPFQSTGAEGVNHLANKIVLALFPPGGSYFRLSLDSFLLAELASKASEAGIDVGDARAEFDEALSRVERAVVSQQERRSHRPGLYESVRLLIVSGNVLIHLQEDGTLRFFKLDSYVVKRDKSGNVLETIARENVARAALPPEILATLPEPSSGDEKAAEKNVEIYTRVVRSDGKWEVWQEVEGQIVESTRGTYPLDKPAWIPLRWTRIDGEDYGRGHAEEYLGDLKSAEVLAKAIVQFAAVAARIILFVNEAGVTQAEDVTDAESGDVLPGDAKDVTILQLEKYADFRVANDVRADIEQRLSRRFLLHSSIQRNAERVTAEEIRIMAGELETALGGVYSLLSQELQRPLVVRLLHVLQKSGDLPALPDGAVEPEIIAGLEGLGRSSDLNKLDLFLIGIRETFGPEIVSKFVNIGSYLRRRAAALGVDVEGLVRSDQEIQEADARAAQSQMAEKLGPAAMRMATDTAKIQTETQPTS